MKNRLFGFLLILAVFTLSLSSCDDYEDSSCELNELIIVNETGQEIGVDVNNVAGIIQRGGQKSFYVKAGTVNFTVFAGDNGIQEFSTDVEECGITRFTIR